MPGWITSYEKGGEVHSNTVTYTAHYNEEATIDVVGGAVNPTAIYIAAGIGLLALLLIGGVIFWRRRQQRPGAAEPALVPAGAAGAASGSPWGDMPSMSAPTIPSSLTPPAQPPSASDQTPTP
jgi:LPXTG-motif cell wall-anchored protein